MSRCNTINKYGRIVTEKPYAETKKAVKELVIKYGVDNILNMHLTELYDQDHNVGNVSNALNYFRYSPQAAKYRR